MGQGLLSKRFSFLITLFCLGYPSFGYPICLIYGGTQLSLTLSSIHWWCSKEERVHVEECAKGENTYLLFSNSLYHQCIIKIVYNIFIYGIERTFDTLLAGQFEWLLYNEKVHGRRS